LQVSAEQKQQTHSPSGRLLPLIQEAGKPSSSRALTHSASQSGSTQIGLAKGALRNPSYSASAALTPAIGKQTPENTQTRWLANNNGDATFLKPGEPESFEADVTFSTKSFEFEFAVDGVYGTNIVVNAESGSSISYRLIGLFPSSLDADRFIARGDVKLGEPLDFPKLLVPGYRYSLRLTVLDDNDNFKVGGSVTLNRFKATEAAQFRQPPRRTMESQSNAPFRGLPIAVGDKYTKQALALEDGGGCYTVYPCHGQERVKVEVDFTDNIYIKYGHLFFSSNTRTDHPVNTNRLVPIKDDPDVADQDRETRASAIYTDDPSWNGTFIPGNKEQRPWYNEFGLRPGEPNTVCITAPWAKTSGATPSEDEQKDFSFSVTSLNGNQNCDLREAFNWQSLSPTPPDNRQALKIGLSVGFGALGLAGLTLITGFLCHRHRLRNTHHQNKNNHQTPSHQASADVSREQPLNNDIPSVIDVPVGRTAPPAPGTDTLGRAPRARIERRTSDPSIELSDDGSDPEIELPETQYV